MSWVAAAVAGGSVLSYVGGQNAERAQRDATRSANEMQRYMYDQTRADNEPWRQAGQRALLQMDSDPSLMRNFSEADFVKDPGYDFRMKQGQMGVQSSAAARGGLNSGATMKALQRYGQDYASNEYNNAYNRFNADRDQKWNKLSGLAGIGQNAQNQVGNAGQNYSNQFSQNQMAMGNAQAANAIAQSNNMTNLMGQGLMAYGMYGKRR